MIEIKEIKNDSDLKKFVTFPFKLYKNSKYWIPPIISEEMNNFKSDINPSLKDSSISLFIAIKDNEVVGRIAAIINWVEINNYKVRKIRFGWFDVINDINVTKLLINRIKEIGKANKLEYMEGPMGFSNLDKVGVLKFTKFASRSLKMGYKGDVCKLLAMLLLMLPIWSLYLITLFGVIIWVPWHAVSRLGNRSSSNVAHH